MPDYATPTNAIQDIKLQPTPAPEQKIGAGDSLPALRPAEKLGEPTATQKYVLFLIEKARNHAGSESMLCQPANTPPALRLPPIEGLAPAENGNANRDVKSAYRDAAHDSVEAILQTLNADSTGD